MVSLGYIQSVFQVSLGYVQSVSHVSLDYIEILSKSYIFWRVTLWGTEA